MWCERCEWASVLLVLDRWRGRRHRAVRRGRRTQLATARGAPGPRVPARRQAVAPPSIASAAPPPDHHHGSLGNGQAGHRAADAGTAPGDHHDLRRQPPGHRPKLALLPDTRISTPCGPTATDCTVSPSGSAGICTARCRIGSSSAAGTPLAETRRRTISCGLASLTRAMAVAASIARLADSFTMCGPSLLIFRPGTAARPGSLARLAKVIRPVPLTWAMVPNC